MTNETLIQKIGQGVQKVIEGSMLATLATIMLGVPLYIAGKTAHYIATTDFYNGRYENIRIQKEVNKKGTRIILQEIGHSTAEDPVIFADILPNGEATRIRECGRWIFAYREHTRLHRYSNPETLSEIVKCATNKQSNLTKWTGFKKHDLLNLHYH